MLFFLMIVGIITSDCESIVQTVFGRCKSSRTLMDLMKGNDLLDTNIKAVCLDSSIIRLLTNDSIVSIMNDPNISEFVLSRLIFSMNEGHLTSVLNHFDGSIHSLWKSTSMSRSAVYSAIRYYGPLSKWKKDYFITMHAFLKAGIAERFFSSIDNKDILVYIFLKLPLQSFTAPGSRAFCEFALRNIKESSFASSFLQSTLINCAKISDVQDLFREKRFRVSLSQIKPSLLSKPIGKYLLEHFDTQVETIVRETPELLRFSNLEFVWKRQKSHNILSDIFFNTNSNSVKVYIYNLVMNHRNSKAIKSDIQKYLVRYMDINDLNPIAESSFDEIVPELNVPSKDIPFMSKPVGRRLVGLYFNNKEFGRKIINCQDIQNLGSLSRFIPLKDFNKITKKQCWERLLSKNNTYLSNEQKYFISKQLKINFSESCSEQLTTLLQFDSYAQTNSALKPNNVHLLRQSITSISSEFISRSRPFDSLYIATAIKTWHQSALPQHVFQALANKIRNDFSLLLEDRIQFSLKNLTSVELLSLPGEVLREFWIDELFFLSEDDCRETISLIGQTNVDDLTLIKREHLVNVYFKRCASSNEQDHFRILQKLSCSIPPKLFNFFITFSDKHVGDNFDRCKIESRNFAQLLQNQRLNDVDFLDVNFCLLTKKSQLNESIDKLSSSDLLELIDTQLWKPIDDSHTQCFELLVNKIIYKMATEGRFESNCQFHLEPFKCNTLKLLAAGNRFVNVKLIAGMSDCEFRRCLSTIGRKIEWFTEDQRIAFGRKLNTIKININEFYEANRLLPYSNVSRFVKYLDDCDAISFLGGIEHWPQSIDLYTLVGNIKLNSQIIYSMGNLVCGLSSEQISKIIKDDNVFEVLHAVTMIKRPCLQLEEISKIVFPKMSSYRREKLLKYSALIPDKSITNLSPSQIYLLPDSRIADLPHFENIVPSQARYILENRVNLSDYNKTLLLRIINNGEELEVFSQPKKVVKQLQSTTEAIPETTSFYFQPYLSHIIYITSNSFSPNFNFLNLLLFMFL